MEAPIKRFVGPAGAIAQFIGLKAKTFTLRIESWSGGHIAAININNQLMYRGLVATTPIAENQTTWHILIMVKKTGFFWKDIFARAGFGWQNQVGAIEDIPVFNSMRHDGGGAYIPYDRVMLKFREFYQTWVDKVEV
ncbi:hypothetical protein [Nostoc sp. WHI]|uniref:hypothetical protein n=1 Tax=Nostoc sp. WHI TaxID=2650611 RepID=UPI0018C46CF7|nr:hypothetical protein [Nostoc sp. WHI]MBG1272010.1 hypothetical protein [Nostoc sp. WHI]